MRLSDMLSGEDGHDNSADNENAQENDLPSEAVKSDEMAEQRGKSNSFAIPSGDLSTLYPDNGPEKPEPIDERDQSDDRERHDVLQAFSPVARTLKSGLGLTNIAANGDVIENSVHDIPPTPYSFPGYVSRGPELPLEMPDVLPLMNSEQQRPAEPEVPKIVEKSGEPEEPVTVKADVTPMAKKTAKSNEPVFEDSNDLMKADEIHHKLFTILNSIYEEGRQFKPLSIERLILPINKLIELCKSQSAILRKAVRLKTEKSSFAEHSLNAAIVSIKIAIRMKYSDERIFSLALCALLGDIGMTRVPPEILNKKGKLSGEEFMEIKRHVDHSVEIAKSIADKFPFLAPILYQIHERVSGNGYPRGLRTNNIHDFAKIIAMSDVYIALTEPKASREKYSGYVALQQLISRRGIDFDAKTVKTLIDVISVFPLESLVMLNNGAIGRVIGISTVHPTRPKMEIIINSDGEKLIKHIMLDLEKEPLLYIEDPDIEEGIIL